METPAFLPVGTYGAVKGIAPEELKLLGTQMVLTNAFHLHDRPGEDVVHDLGGIHQFMHWDGLILTDSGGYQIYSLEKNIKLDDEGVTFPSPVDGRPLRLTPEDSMGVQLRLDSDIAMAFDHCPPLPSPPKEVEAAVERTTQWASRCRDYHSEHNAGGQALFGIVQGGLDDNLRARSAEGITALGFDGYAIGGLSVGESTESRTRATTNYASLLPPSKIRYLMGVGHPRDIITAISAGFDIFDCVYPTRNGRHGSVFIDEGVLHVRNEANKGRPGPISQDCDCPACLHWDVGAIRHFLMAGEPLGQSLCSAHNLRYLHRLVSRARQAILDGKFADFQSTLSLV